MELLERQWYYSYIYYCNVISYTTKSVKSKMNIPDEKALYFSHRVRQRMGTNIRGIYLFGSHARGDFHKGSDYDFMVVLDKFDPHLKDEILDIETDFLNKFDEVSACVVYDETSWEWRKNSPLGINIMREGIAL